MKKLISLITIFLVICIHTLSFADVGSFESYDSWDSGSDWSSSWDSDWDSSSSWSDSSWDSDWDDDNWDWDSDSRKFIFFKSSHFKYKTH